MNWTEVQQKDINLARRGLNSLQDLEKEYGLPVAAAMWKELDEDDDKGTTEEERKAHQFGREQGTAAASHVFDGNTEMGQYYKVFNGIAEGDPEVADLEPNPLSGEWADGLDELTVLSTAGNTDDHVNEENAHLISAFEDGFNTAFWDEIDRVCRYHLKGTEWGDLAGIDADGAGFGPEESKS